MPFIYGRPDSEKQLLDMYPKRVKRFGDIPNEHRKLVDELNSRDSGIFAGIRKWRKRRKIAKFEKNRANPFYAGAKGEIDTLRRLTHLSDHYHVLCGVQAVLPRYVTYNGRRNLRTAQLDFVVVSCKGIILIEAKNWSKQYYNQQMGMSPHEQVDRAGRVLWIKIKSKWGRFRRNYPRVTSVLLSTRGEMNYDPNFRFVYVSNLHKINYFIENRREQLSQREVKKIVKMLKKLVTNRR